MQKKWELPLLLPPWAVSKTLTWGHLRSCFHGDGKGELDAELCQDDKYMSTISFPCIFTLLQFQLAAMYILEAHLEQEDMYGPD